MTRGLIRPRRVYLAVAAVVFAVEVGIAVFASGGFIRHTLGDALVVVLIYSLLRGLTPVTPEIAAITTFAFAVSVEAAQGADIVRRLGLDGSALARTLIGTTFSWADIAAYAAGAAAAFGIDAGARAARDGG